MPPASNTLAMLRWSIMVPSLLLGLRSWPPPVQRSMPGFNNLMRDLAPYRLFLLGQINRPHPAFANFLEQFVTANIKVAAFLVKGGSSAFHVAVMDGFRGAVRGFVWLSVSRRVLPARVGFEDGTEPSRRNAGKASFVVRGGWCFPC